MTQHNNSIKPDWFTEGQKQWEILSVFWVKEIFARSVFIWIISTIEIPIMLLTLYALCFLIKSHRAASVFVIHLILSDLIQIICLIYLSARPVKIKRLMVEEVHEYTVMTGLYFMACIAFERYLLVAHPIWHKTHQTLKSSCLISLIICFIPLIFAKFTPTGLTFDQCPSYVAYLIPYPIIILCFVGTWRGLSQSISLTSQKRRMILGTLFLVLLSYTFIILPFPLTDLFAYVTKLKFRWSLTFIQVRRFVICLLHLNPLADCLLYLFMRSDAAALLSSLHCCCTSDRLSVRYTTRTPQSSS